MIPKVHTTNTNINGTISKVPKLIWPSTFFLKNKKKTCPSLLTLPCLCQQKVLFPPLSKDCSIVPSTLLYCSNVHQASILPLEKQLHYTKKHLQSQKKPLTKWKRKLFMEWENIFSNHKSPKYTKNSCNLITKINFILFLVLGPHLAIFGLFLGPGDAQGSFLVLVEELFLAVLGDNMGHWR